MNKRFLTTFIFLFFFNRFVQAQAIPNCNLATEFCTSSVYLFPNSTNVASLGANGIYGCLGSTPNPKLFYMQVTTSGNVIFTINQTNLSNTPIDVDYVCWGPFASPADGCTNISAANIVSCSYSGSASETCTINGAVAGQYYYLLCTNFSNQVGQITFVEAGASTGSSQCTSNCAISAITASPTACTFPVNTYSLIGQISFTSPPSSGTLSLISSNGNSTTFSAPFTSPINYILPNLTANGLTATVTASFSADGICFSSNTYQSPTPCNTCFVTPSNNGPICVGSTINLFANSSTSATYSWIGPNGFISSDQNPVITNATALAAGTYTLSASAMPSGFTCNSITTIGLIPTPSVTATSVSVCSGQTSNISAIPSSLGGSYLWMPGGSTIQSLTVTPNINATYTVSYTLAGCSTVATATASVTVKPTPIVTCNSASICIGQSAVLTASASLTGGTFHWTPGSQTTQSIAVSPSSTTQYVVFYNLNGCTNASGASVTLVTTPSISINSQTICSGSSATLTASAVPLGGFYSWSNGLGTTQSISVNPIATTTYSLTYTSIGCSNLGIGSGSVVVKPSPSVISNSETICDGQSATLVAYGSPIGGSYQWISAASTTDSLVVTPTTTSSFIVSYSYAGCDANSVSEVEVNSNPAIPTITELGTTLISSSATGNQWFLDGLPIAGATSQLYTVVQNGNYTVQVSSNNCFSSSDDFVLINIGMPESSKDKLISIFPNPSSGVFKIYAPNYSKEKMFVTILTVLGETIYFTQIENYTTELNLKLMNGVYFISFQTEKVYFTERLIISGVSK